MQPIELSSFWLATCDPDVQPSLSGDQETDIVVIGAGFTGLWTALFLKELSPRSRVMVLEQQIAGYGGSGRNGGILGETIDHSHQLAISHFGIEEARKLAELGRQNIREMSEFFDSKQLDCDFEATGRLFVALTQPQIHEIRQTVETAQRLGISDVRFLSTQEVRNELNSPLYLAGAFAAGGGVLNPAKLIRGLKRLALEMDVRIFEQTPVTHVTSGTVQTSSGSVQAGKIILATNAFTHHLVPSLLKRFIPLYDYVLVSEPLTSAQMDSIGWKHRQGVTDARTFFNYYRLTADNRVLWGTSEAMYYPPNRVEESCDHSESHYRELHDSFYRHFPQLEGLPFPFAWGGPIASTTRLTPCFGSLYNGRLLYALGYTGHGVGSSRIAGKILAHMTMNRPHELLQLSMVRKLPFPYPPEPLRSLAVRKVTNALRQLDEGKKPGLLLRLMERLRIGFSS